MDKPEITEITGTVQDDLEDNLDLVRTTIASLFTLQQHPWPNVRTGYNAPTIIPPRDAPKKGVRVVFYLPCSLFSDNANDFDIKTVFDKFLAALISYEQENALIGEYEVVSANVMEVIGMACFRKVPRLLLAKEQELGVATPGGRRTIHLFDGNSISYSWPHWKLRCNCCDLVGHSPQACPLTGEYADIVSDSSETKKWRNNNKPRDVFYFDGLLPELKRKVLAHLWQQYSLAQMWQLRLVKREWMEHVLKSFDKKELRFPYVAKAPQIPESIHQLITWASKELEVLFLPERFPIARLPDLPKVRQLGLVEVAINEQESYQLGELWKKLSKYPNLEILCINPDRLQLTDLEILATFNNLRWVNCEVVSKPAELPFVIIDGTTRISHPHFEWQHMGSFPNDSWLDNSHVKPDNAKMIPSYLVEDAIRKGYHRTLTRLGELGWPFHKDKRFRNVMSSGTFDSEDLIQDKTYIGKILFDFWWRKEKDNKMAPLWDYCKIADKSNNRHALEAFARAIKYTSEAICQAIDRRNTNFLDVFLSLQPKCYAPETIIDALFQANDSEITTIILRHLEVEPLPLVNRALQEGKTPILFSLCAYFKTKSERFFSHRDVAVGMLPDDALTTLERAQVFFECGLNIRHVKQIHKVNALATGNPNLIAFLKTHGVDVDRIEIQNIVSQKKLALVMSIPDADPAQFEEVAEMAGIMQENMHYQDSLCSDSQVSVNSSSTES